MLNGATVITLEETPERLAGFMVEWKRAAVPLPLHVAKSHLDPYPVRGCWTAHIAALQESDGPTLILEDDAVFHPKFTLDVAFPADWEVLYFGGYFPRRKPTDPFVHRVFRAGMTHAYAVKDPQKIAEMLGPWRKGNNIGATLSRLRVVKYAVNPNTVGQRGGAVSTINGVLRSVDNYFERKD